MIGLMGDEENHPQERCSLLQHYSSETVAHAGFLLTIGIIVTAFIDRVLGMFPPTYANLIYHGLVAVLLIPLTVAIIYLTGRFMCWGYLASNIMLVRPRDLKLNDVDKEFLDATQILVRLDYGATENVKRQHPRLKRHLSSLGKYLRWPVPYFASILVGVVYMVIVCVWILA